MKKMACLHAHYSNIDYIQNALADQEMELTHFVDPGLMSRITSDEGFDLVKVQDKIIEQLEWIAQTNVDVILITCTHYIALLDEDRLNTPIPIIKIDELCFSHICSIPGPQVLLFTNPATVEGTMRRLGDYAKAKEKSISAIEIRVIEDAFELIMQGKEAQYLLKVSDYIKQLLAIEANKPIFVAQLSMVKSAEKVELELGVQIGNPLKTVVSFLK